MKQLLTLIILFFSSVGFAQKPIIQDDFSINKYGWERNEVCSFANQEYIINAMAEGAQSFINFYLDPQRDFVLSADVKQQSGGDKDGFGIFWSSGDTYYNLFLITSKGEYMIYSGNPSLLKTKSELMPLTQKVISTNLKLKAKQMIGIFM